LPDVPSPGEALAETRYRTIDVAGLKIFYREAGPAAAPVVLLLHGFPTSVRSQYVAGTREPSLIDPDNWTIDSALLARPGVDEIMLDLLYDIRNNRQTVADARQFFKAHQRQVMISTGVNDPLFPGASMRPPADMPEIEFHPIDSGHFALEDHCAEIGALTRGFLARVMPA
jgi:pimeloyl-ACP methyl ester carboxylesterase